MCEKRKTGRYEEGARNRQAALDYINAHPGAKAPDIIKALGWDKIGGSARLQKMADAEELSRVTAWYDGVNSAGYRYCQKTFAYTALVIKTRQAEAVDVKESESRPGVIRNDPSKHSPNRNDAQGSGVEFCGIRSTLG